MSPEYTGRKSRGRRQQVPKRPWEAVVDSLAIPRSVLERSGLTEGIVMCGERKVFVSYPESWRSITICGASPEEEKSLMLFVIGAVHPGFGAHGLETLDLDHTDLGRIPSAALKGLHVRETTFLPHGRERLTGNHH